jgi:hypothetical protein
MTINSPQRHDSDFSKNLKELILKRANRPSDVPTADQPTADKQKPLDVQVITGDLENILKTMDQADARVQRATAKLHELKTAVMLATAKS